jgi:hypothetical protein
MKIYLLFISKNENEKVFLRHSFGVLHYKTFYHIDKTRVQMPAKIFPHLKVKCQLFMGPNPGFDTAQRNSFLIKVGVFLQLKQDSDNIIHS